jgi:hypothetical protein
MGGILNVLSQDLLRRLTLALGLGTVLVGLAPLLFPRRFAEAFGLPMADNPALDVMIRSVSARDAINGAGIMSATLHGGRVVPWLLARAVADGTDTVAIGIAWASGARSGRLLLLGGIALAAFVVDLVLYTGHRAARAVSSGQAA